MVRVSMTLLATVLGLAGCAMEQYHFPQTQDKVPVNVIVAYSEEHPNEVIKSIQEEKMFDGSTRYTFVINNGKTLDKTVSYTSDGKAIR